MILKRTSRAGSLLDPEHAPTGQDRPYRTGFCRGNPCGYPSHELHSVTFAGGLLTVPQSKNVVTGFDHPRFDLLGVKGLEYGSGLAHDASARWFEASPEGESDLENRLELGGVDHLFWLLSNSGCGARCPGSPYFSGRLNSPELENTVLAHKTAPQGLFALQHAISDSRTGRCSCRRESVDREEVTLQALQGRGRFTDLADETVFQALEFTLRRHHALERFGGTHHVAAHRLVQGFNLEQSLG